MLGAMVTTSAYSEKVENIRQRFLIVLSERLDHFENIRENLPTALDPGALLEEIRFGAHRTVGLAATLGYRDLGDLAQKVEIAILNLTESSGKALVSVALLELLDELLGEMALVVAS